MQVDLDKFATESQIIGLDLGAVRTGVAVAPAGSALALPLCVLPTEPRGTLVARLKQLLAGRSLGLLVCGLPLNAQGALGPEARAILALAEQLAAELKLPLKLVDERFSTRAVQRPPPGKTRRKSPPGSPDAQAAALILQSYLDQQAAQSG